jgi:hypothetical protein
MDTATHLQDAYNEVMGDRSASDFASFEDFWADFDEAMHYDAVDNDESVADFREEIRGIFDADLAEQRPIPLSNTEEGL